MAETPTPPPRSARPCTSVAVSLAAFLLLTRCAPTQEGPPPRALAEPPPDTSFFTGAPPFASAPVPLSAAAAHRAKKVSVSMPAVPACLSCHKPGGKGAPFVFAGTVFADNAATRGAPDIEIRVVDAKGNVMSTHSDADGNFWVKGSGPLAEPARAGARDGAKMRVMRDATSTGDCNSCHTTEVPFVF